MMGRVKDEASPNHHFRASPFRDMVVARSGTVHGCSRLPTVRGRVVTPSAGIIDDATEDDKFRSRPYTAVTVALDRRVGGGNQLPTVGGRVVPSTGSLGKTVGIATPEDD